MATQHEMLENGLLNTLAIYFHLLAKREGWATDRTFMLNKSAPTAAGEIASVLYVLAHVASDNELLRLNVVEEAIKNNPLPVQEFVELGPDDAGWLGSLARFSVTISNDHVHTLLCALSLAIRHSKDDRANPYRDMQVYLCELAGIDGDWIATGQFPPRHAAEGNPVPVTADAALNAAETGAEGKPFDPDEMIAL